MVKLWTLSKQGGGSHVDPENPDPEFIEEDAVFVVFGKHFFYQSSVRSLGEGGVRETLDKVQSLTTG